jgi:hypothetical protein
MVLQSPNANSRAMNAKGVLLRNRFVVLCGCWGDTIGLGSSTPLGCVLTKGYPLLWTLSGTEEALEKY